MTDNRAAFLYVIRVSEGTQKAPNPWAVTFGDQYTITDFSDHPAVLGTWPGLHWTGGLSTAAGAYQIIKPTWLVLKHRLSLPDFSRDSQDQAALELIRERLALPLIDAGQFQTAIERCSSVWASLPGSAAGQPITKMANLIDAYGNAGGSFA